MITIWKFPVEVADKFTLDMPSGARVLDVQVQGGGVQLWAIVNDQAPKVKRRFAVRGTGHSAEGLDQGGPSYVGTFQIHGGRLVFHLFDCGVA